MFKFDKDTGKWLKWQFCGEPDVLKLLILLASQKQYDLCISSDIVFFLAKPWLDHMVAGHTYYKAVQTGKVSLAYFISSLWNQTFEFA